MEYSTRFLLLLAIATFISGPIRAQKWTFQEIGEGWQSDAAEDEAEQSIDYRFISYKKVLATGAKYMHSNLVSYVRMVVDDEREQILVGGRDSLYRLSLDNLSLIQKTDWIADPERARTCLAMGLAEDVCHNFMRVLLLTSDNKVFTCGTYAYNPNCTLRKIDDLSTVLQYNDGKGICPYNPEFNATALMTANGDVYSALIIGATGRDVAIFRDLGTSPSLRTQMNDDKWLNEPSFVSTHEIGNSIYFFFREAAVEYINCGKIMYSRVARICKNDKGGGSIYKSGLWTTFYKARLNCSLPGDYPFYFNDIQGTYYSQEEGLVYAVFQTPPNSMAGSAVCVYNMQAFNKSFTGPFKFQDNPTSAWTKHDNKYNLGMCDRNASDVQEDAEFIMAVGKYQQMDSAVQPRELGPLIMRENERWTHVVVDQIATKMEIYNILFLASTDGKIRKMVRLPGTSQTCLIEEIKIVENGHPRPVRNMKISKEKGAIYISTDGEILKLPVERCYRFTDKVMCSNAQDPYCGWNTQTRQCTPAPKGNVHNSNWEQHITRCPMLDYPVNGGWSDWGKWSVCHEAGNDPVVDKCQCRSRTCTRPKPLNNGLDCQGASMEISNCTYKLDF